MKKALSMLLIATMLFAFGGMSAMAADDTAVSVETPVAMSLVSSADGNYKYDVSVNATVTSGGSALADTQVSILMFGNKDNSAFVSGDNVVNLTAEEIAANYYVYYVNQDATDSLGKVSFAFPVDFPAPAKTDAYYVWVGAETASAPEKLGLDKLSVSSQVVAVTLTADKTEVDSGEGVTLTPSAENVFGNNISAEYSYTVTQNGTTIADAIANNTLATYNLSGIYSISVKATGANGTTATSESISITVNDDIILGDTDFNGRISVMDAVLVLKHVADISLLEGKAITAADVSGNGTIETQDAIVMLKYIARIINNF